MWSITRAWMGKMRSTPWPKLTLRTVMLSPMPVFLRAITVPSKACKRSLSPSLIFTCTRMVSPGRNSGVSVRLFLLMTFVNRELCISNPNFLFYVIWGFWSPAAGMDACPTKQVRPQARGFLQCGPLPPAADFFVISAQQNIRHLPSSKLGGTRVLRAIEHGPRMSAILKGLEHCRRFVAQYTRQQAGHGVNYDRRRQLAAAQHIIPYGQLVIGQMLGHALVHAFITPANEQQLRQAAKIVGHLLVEQAALRGEKHLLYGQARKLSYLQDRLDRQKQGLRLEQHAFPAPERPVVHGLVPVGRPIPQIVYANLDGACIARPLDHAML